MNAYRRCFDVEYETWTYTYVSNSVFVVIFQAKEI